MSVFVNTLGNSVLAVGICDRCKRTFPLLELEPDRNSPGLRVCADDNDEFDPYRLPARTPDSLALPFVRPDADVAAPLIGTCDVDLLATETPVGMESEVGFGLVPDDYLAELECINEHVGFYSGTIGILAITVSVLVSGSSVRVSWPLLLGFEVDHFEVYAVHDITNPTPAQYTLVTTLGPTVSSYTDPTVYTSSYSYIVVAIGSGSFRASSPAVSGKYVAPPVLGIVGTVNVTTGPDNLPPFFTAQGLFPLSVSDFPPAYVSGALNSNSTAYTPGIICVQSNVPNVVVGFYSTTVLLQTAFTSVNVGGLGSVLSASASSFIATPCVDGIHTHYQWTIPWAFGALSTATPYNFTFT